MMMLTLAAKRVGQRCILQEEVEAAAGNADEDEHQLVPPGELQSLGRSAHSVI